VERRGGGGGVTTSSSRRGEMSSQSVPFQFWPCGGGLSSGVDSTIKRAEWSEPRGGSEGFQEER